MPIFGLPSTSVPNNWELSGLFDVEREGLQISLPFGISKMHSSKKEDGFLNLWNQNASQPGGGTPVSVKHLTSWEFDQFFKHKTDTLGSRTTFQLFNLPISGRHQFLPTVRVKSSRTSFLLRTSIFDHWMKKSISSIILSKWTRLGQRNFVKLQ
jgi:hypothetical protein